MIPALLLLIGQWPDTVPVISLDFDQEQWEYACENYWQDIYIPAEFSIDGTTHSCQFRIRGATSRAYPRKSIKIELPEGVFVFGRDEFNLNAEYLDRSRLRELLSYLYYAEIGRIVPEAHLVELVFNGETQGAYISVEDVDGDFLLNTALPDEAVIYKCADRYSTLDRIYDLEPYRKKTRSEDPWDDLFLLMYWLRYCPSEMFRQQLMERFHYDDLLCCVAANVLIGHGSTYYHNYHLVLDSSGSSCGWRYITWDMDRTWSVYGPEVEYFRNSSGNGNRRNTLIWRMWCDSGVRSDLIQKIHDQYPLMQGFIQSGVLDSLAVLAAPLVEIDPYRDYPMEVFWQHVNVMSQWPEVRYANLQTQFSQWPEPFSITPPSGGSGDLLFTWQSAGDQCSWRIVISPDSLFSDPSHFLYEAFPGDTFHTVPERLASNETWLQVFCERNGVECRASNGPVHPASVTEASFGSGAVITEINYSSSPVFDPGDWFEVANITGEPLNLSGWSVRDGTAGNLTTVRDVMLQPGECLVFAADTFLFQESCPGIPGALHSLGFSLSQQGEPISLRDPAGFTSDTVHYSQESPWPQGTSGTGSTLLLSDTRLNNLLPASWVRGPFGGTPGSLDSWWPDWASRGAVTMKVIGPLPSAGSSALSLELLASAPVQAEAGLYDLSGRQVTPPIPLSLETGQTTLVIPIDDLPAGTYFAVLRHMGYTESRKITVTGKGS